MRLLIRPRRPTSVPSSILIPLEYSLFVPSCLNLCVDGPDPTGHPLPFYVRVQPWVSACWRFRFLTLDRSLLRHVVRKIWKEYGYQKGKCSQVGGGGTPIYTLAPTCAPRRTDQRFSEASQQNDQGFRSVRSREGETRPLPPPKRPPFPPPCAHPPSPPPLSSAIVKGGIRVRVSTVRMDGVYVALTSPSGFSPSTSSARNPGTVKGPVAPLERSAWRVIGNRILLTLEPTPQIGRTTL
ncbi:hypothetical protein DB88DRAFT_491946 [Papiliotrema laurentii]|uniref:Uncharacterized protein n=1 Tax=Papiliotrema laurentii TaxID=5418 RepID=A0AAD9CX95_PAPLA|nr:hypothetical protein DB88DRAFT_491946 [Papiliotrema laurentii]